MTKRQIHTFIRKYNEFNSRFGDDQFNIRVIPYADAEFGQHELYDVHCGKDEELHTSEVSELLEYVKKEVDYLQDNLSQSEGSLQEQLEDPAERRAFREGIRYLKAVCAGKHYKE